MILYQISNFHKQQFLNKLKGKTFFLNIFYPHNRIEWNIFEIMKQYFKGSLKTVFQSSNAIYQNVIINISWDISRNVSLKFYCNIPWNMYESLFKYPTKVDIKMLLKSAKYMRVLNKGTTSYWKYCWINVLRNVIRTTFHSYMLWKIYPLLYILQSL